MRVAHVRRYYRGRNEFRLHHTTRLSPHLNDLEVLPSSPSDVQQQFALVVS